MKPFPLHTKYLFFILFGLGSLSTNLVFAANGNLVYAPLEPAAIPTLGGTMLIILSLLLFAVSLKRAKKTRSNGTHFVFALLAVGTLILASSGVKLISDAYAAVQHSMVASGGNLPIVSYELNNYTNNTGVSQQINNITLPEDIDTNTEALTTNDCADKNPPSSGFPRCQVGAVLADGQSCSIDCAFSSSLE